MPKIDHLEFEVDRAVNWLMHMLSIEGMTGKEKAVGEEVVRLLRDIGVPATAMAFDKANLKIPLPTETGNLIVKLKGNRKGPRRLFMTHLDTVPLCAGAVPKRKGNRIFADSPTALGADNRVGVSCLINMVANLLQKNLPHPPITIVFTVREESGLWGARHLNPADLGKDISMCFNIDGRSPEELAIGAVGADRWHVEIKGLAAHAGAHPELGVSAIMVASIALADVKRKGWFGRIVKNGKQGTSNVGVVGDSQGRSAGAATNVVTDHVIIHGESRSHDSGFIGEITKAYKEAFQSAAKEVTNVNGKNARIKFQASRDYHPFRLPEKSEVVLQAITAAEQAGLSPTLRTIDGGLDANWMVKHKIPTVTFGAGQNKIHTVDEYVELKDFEKACRFALALATM